MMLQVVNCDCIDLLESLSRVRCGFADPPDGISLNYNTYSDKLRGFDYYFFLERVIKLMSQKCDVVWLSVNAKHTLYVGRIIANLLDADDTLAAKSCVQTFTFGQNNKHDLTENHRPLIRINRKGETWDMEAVKVPSWRQQNGDKRAAEGGKSPSTVFDFPRVTGNSKQRRAYHPTQLNEGLVERCLKMSMQCGDTVVDPFAGTGTTLRVAKTLGLNCITGDMDLMYCEKIAEEHGLEKATGKHWKHRWFGGSGTGVAAEIDTWRANHNAIKYLIEEK
jgi:site-specific DNA-methyltransferase (adenine-specific)